MDGEKWKIQIGANIADYRRRAGLTQAGLAEKLNYSDKAVSKWERGESVLDVLTLAQLSRELGVTPNDLLADPEEPWAAAEPAAAPETGKKRRANRGVIQLLSSLLVWFVALLVFVVLSSSGVPYSWLAFFYAVPVNAIVLLSLRSAWHNFSKNQLLISTIMWGVLTGLYVTLLVFLKNHIWKIFLLGIPGQTAIFAWFRMFSTTNTTEEHNE